MAAGDRKRNDALKRERTRQRRRLTAIQRDTSKEILRLLKTAEDDIVGRLAAGATEFEQFLLPVQQRAVRQAMAAFGTGAAKALNDGAGRSWQAGAELVDKPIEAGFAAGGAPEVRLAAILPEIDTRQLAAIRAFMTDRMADISATVANRVNAELGLALIGSQTTGEAAGKISGLIKTGGRSRALTIVRTELGRAYSIAGQERQAQAAEVLPGLRKQWRRSGRLLSRAEHDIIDGQLQPVDQPFQVSGEGLMFPRDPKGSAKNTINCGCTSLPFMESWEVSQPGRQPFSADELARNPNKRLLDSVLGVDSTAA